MGTFRNVSRLEPCPICGKSDWCSILTSDSPTYPGEELIVCRRITEPHIASSINGKNYTFLKDLKDDSYLYCETASLERTSSNGSEYRFRKHPTKDTTLTQKQEPGIPPLENEALDKIYRYFLSMLPLINNHQRKLRHDGWSNQLIKNSKIRSLYLQKTFDPIKKFYHDGAERKKICDQLIQKFDNLLGVPGFYQDTTDNHWTFTGKAGMLIPIRDRHRFIYRLRLRLDHPDLDEKGKEHNKYKNFSAYYLSRNDKGILMNAFHNGCRAGGNLGIYYTPARDKLELCYITEGEKKAIVTNDTLYNPVISLPGVSSYEKLLEKDDCQEDIIDFFVAKGCINFAIAFDADKYVNEKVMRCEKKLVNLLKKKGVHVYIAYWNPAFGKGLDDILALGIRPTLIPV